MGTLQLSELITEVRGAHAGRLDLTDERIITGLNLAQQRIARRHDFEELRTVETGSVAQSTQYINFTDLSTVTNPREIYSFTIKDPSTDLRACKLTNWTARTFDQRVPNPEAHDEGMPSSYVNWKERFELWRIPDQTYNYTIRLSFWPTAFTSSVLSAKSDFREKDDLLIFLTVSWEYAKLGEYEKANRFFAMFRTELETATGEDATRPDRDIKPPAGAAQPDITSDQYWLNPFIVGTRGRGS